MKQIVTLPWPPSVNHYWIPSVRIPSFDELAKAPRKIPLLFKWLRKNCRSYVRLSKDAKDFRLLAITACRAAGIESYGSSRLQVSIELQPPALSHGDVDGRNKGILDALEHASVYDNDKQVRGLLVFFGLRHPGDGAVIVTIEPIGN